jgi:beta-phosphoglucomutase-like phosphatase (HAD superfamily)
VVFFDDSVANVAAAEAAGMRAFHVEGFAALAACLKEEVLF